MKKPPNLQLAELEPFYKVCWLGLLSTGFIPLVLVSQAAGRLFGHAAGRGRSLGVLCPVIAVALFLVLWRVLHGRQRRELEERMARAVTPSRPRLQRTLQALEARLRELSGEASARLILIPESAVVLSTLRGNREPVVEVTVGFLSTYANHPHLMEAALAHEAGHIAARDVERFWRMLGLIRTLPWLALLYLLLAVGVLLWPRGALPADLGGSGVVIFLAASALFVALPGSLAWSALLVAREIQSDAFAVKALGDQRPVQALLRSQLELRAKQAGRRPALQRLRTWLLQPGLRWRSTLPFPRGHLGARVEAKLGVAMASFFFAQVWMLAAGERLLSLLPEPLLRGLRESFVTGETTRVLEVLLALDSLELLELALLVLLGLLVEGATVWGVWIAYRFLWTRSRALLVGGDRGSRSSGLRSLLSFSLPGQALFLGIVLGMSAGVGKVLWEQLLVAAVLQVFAVLLWAAGKLALVCPRERRRERPSLPLALLALLGILVLNDGLTSGLAQVMPRVGLSGLLPPGPPGRLLLNLSYLVTGLGVGALAHRLASRR